MCDGDTIGNTHGDHYTHPHRDTGGNMDGFTYALIAVALFVAITVTLLIIFAIGNSYPTRK